MLCRNQSVDANRSEGILPGILLGLGALLSAGAMSAELPAGVRYERVSDDANARARALVEQAFAGPQVDLFRMLRARAAGDKPFTLGPFMGIRVTTNDATGLEQYDQLHYQVEVSRGVKVRVPSFAAHEPETERQLARRVERLLAGGAPATIRKLTNDELAMIWFWISWDIVEPIYAVEAGREKLILHFVPDGSRLWWIEDVGAPCFKLTEEGRTVVGCHCMHIVWEGLNWDAVFRPSGRECK